MKELHLKALGAACAILASAQGAAAQDLSAWQPSAGQGTLRVGYSHLEYDQFTAGTSLVTPPQSFEQEGVIVDLRYALTDRLGFEFSTGLSRAEFDTEDEGLNDSRFRLRYTLADQADGAIGNLVVAGSVLVAGTYEAGGPTAIGDGVTSFELAGAFGRAFENGFAAEVYFGGRLRTEDAPEDIFAGVAGHYSFAERFILSAGLQRVEALSGVDIGGPGFDPTQFQRLEEDYTRWWVGGSMTLTPVVSVSAYYGQRFDTRNSGISDDFTLSSTFSF